MRNSIKYKDFYELVLKCFDHPNDGFHFWLRSGNNWITGEVADEENGDLYIIIYLTTKVDFLNYPIGDILADSYISLREDKPSKEETDKILKYLLQFEKGK